MNEIKQQTTAKDYRRKLFTGTSMLVLLATSGSSSALAEDEQRPTVWIEAGWHLEQISGSNEPLVPPLDPGLRQAGFTSISELQNVLASSYGAEGSLSFRPNGSDWTFAASIRYGRANGRRYLHQERQFPSSQFSYYNLFAGRTVVKTADMPTGYQDATTKEAETHTVIDFQAGKDVGLGLFGRHGSSTASFGVRYAQVTAQSEAKAFGRPQGQFVGVKENLVGVTKYPLLPFYHNSQSVAERAGSFHGVGPSVSWSNTTPLLGNQEGGELSLDWGANAALLFGRQKLKVHHEVRDVHHSAVSTPIPSYPSKYIGQNITSTAHTVHDEVRVRSVTVPNVGGFAGFSYKFPNAKLSVGYRADFFFGAMDGGLDSHKSITTGFSGPYATVSIGLGG